jgi:uncharacterized protein YaiE (UPF0345 family)
MRITSGGNVGIGTASPSQILDVQAARGAITTTSTTGTNTSYLQVNNTGGSLNIGIDSSTGGSLFGAGGYTAGVWHSGAYPLTFGTSNTERMRITSGGNLLVGTTTDAGFKLDVNGTGRFSGSLRSTSGDVRSISTGSNTAGSGAFYLLGDTTGTNFFINQLNASNGIDWYYYNGSYSSSLFKLTSTGAATFSSLGTGTVYSNGGTLTNTNPSDLNLKTNVTPINYGLDEILKLNPVTFDWKNDTINQGKQYGFIAQEVQKIMPDLVKQGEYLGLDKEAIFTTLVKAIQELNDKIK